MKIIKGFSTKQDGNMKIYLGAVHVADNESQKNKENRKKFLEKAGLKNDNLVLAGLVHGNRIVTVTDKDKGKIISECDGFATNVTDVVLGVTAADCLPIFFWNKQGTVVGIVHAGWRGVQKGIASEMINIFVNKYDCLVKDIKVEIGPHIKDCHFEIQADVVNNFADYPDCFEEKNKIKTLSLEKVIKKQLLSAGVESKNIQDAKDCTFCETDKYFSYRRDKPKDIEAMLAYITIV